MLGRPPDPLDFCGPNSPRDHNFVAEGIVELTDQSIGLGCAHSAWLLAEAPDENKFSIVNLEHDGNNRSRSMPF
jgi:hypothetical protein